MNYFNLTPEQQKTVITQTAGRIGLPMQAVEKDLWVTTLLQLLFTLPFAKEAVSNNELWETIAHHRKLFTSVLGVDYTPDIRKRIQLIPPSNVVAIWEKDYQEMQESMIYGDSLPFDKLLERIHILENRFHNIARL